MAHFIGELGGRIDFSFAYQPIVDAASGRVFSQEALIRGSEGQGAGWVFGQVCADDLCNFDEFSRAAALHLAGELNIVSAINLNLLPRSLRHSRHAVDSTLAAAEQAGVAANKLVLEVTEGELIEDPSHFAALISDYRRRGGRVAIDDFGAGFSGLNLLADFQPDMIKLDMSLVRGIDSHGPRQAIVRALQQACFDLGIDIIAEGVETAPEYRVLAQMGIELFQGYLFAKPGFECLPEPVWP